MTAADIAFVLTVVCIVGIVTSLLYGWLADAPDNAEGREVEDFDRCDDCREPLDDDNRAITCGDHPLCDDCDGAFNPCHVCRYWRRQVTGTDAVGWVVGPDPFLDPRGGAA